jgi:hypothetical protein
VPLPDNLERLVQQIKQHISHARHRSKHTAERPRREHGYGVERVIVIERDLTLTFPRVVADAPSMRISGLRAGRSKPCSASFPIINLSDSSSTTSPTGSPFACGKASCLAFRVP